MAQMWWSHMPTSHPHHSHSVPLRQWSFLATRRDDGGLLSLRSHRQLIYTLAAEHSSADSYSSQQQPDSTAVTAVVPVHRSLEAYKVGLAHRMQTLAAAQCTAMDACQWIPPPSVATGRPRRGLAGLRHSSYKRGVLSGRKAPWLRWVQHVIQFLPYKQNRVS